jgi:hypothetical protein
VKKMRRYCKLCNSFLLVIGPSWVEELEKRSDSAEPDHVKKEVELALESGAQVLPLLVQGAPMPKESDLLKSGIGALAPLHAIEIKEDPSGAAFSESMDRVVRAIETNEK